MTETVSAVVTYGFTVLELHRIEASPLARNTSSRKLLLKLGFVCEGNLRERLLFRNRLEDEHSFGLLKDEWLKVVSL